MTDLVRSLIGVGILVLIGFILSYNRKAISWRTVLAALAVQIAIGAFVLFVPVGKDILGGIANGVTHVLGYGYKGTEFLFGGLVWKTPRTHSPLPATKGARPKPQRRPSASNPR